MDDLTASRLDSADGRPDQTLFVRAMKSIRVCPEIMKEDKRNRKSVRD